MTNGEKMKEFFDCLFGEVKKTYFLEARLIPEKEGDTPYRNFVFADSTERLVSYFERYDGQLHATFGVYPRSVCGGKAEDVGVAQCLFADFDKTDTLVLPKSCPQPNIVVRSGSGYHTYWLYKKPLVIQTEKERELAKDLLFRLSRWVQSDPACKDIARVMRVPYTQNIKYSPPIMTQITKMDCIERLDIEEWNELLPVFHKPVHNPPYPENFLTEMPDYLKAKFAVAVSPGARHNMLLTLGAKAMGAGVSWSVIEQYLRDYAERCGISRNGREVNDILKWLEESKR